MTTTKQYDDLNRLLSISSSPSSSSSLPISYAYVKGSGRTIDSFHRFPPRFRQNVTLLTDPIDNCFPIHRLLTVVSRRNRRAIFTFPTSPLRRRPKSASSQSNFASSSAMIRRAFSSADWPISAP